MFFLQIFSLILNRLRSSTFFFDSGGFVGMSISTETKSWLFLSFDLEIERLSMPGQFWMSSSTKILEIRFLGQKMSFKAPIQSVIYPSDISLSLICQCLEISPGNYLNKKDKGWYSMNLLTFSLFSRLYRDIISSQRNIKIFKLRILIPFFYNSFFYSGESTQKEKVHFQKDWREIIKNLKMNWNGLIVCWHIA